MMDRSSERKNRGMKPSYLIILIILVAATEAMSSFKNAWSFSNPSMRAMRQTQRPVAETEGRGFAVLELFTSEGCSSCPPADQVLAKIQRESEGRAVYLLAYHVDYWDRLGWKDAYSSADFSNRQVQYGHWLNVSPIYTPQVVVNGKLQFTGSDEPAIHQAISEQMAAAPSATLKINTVISGEQLRVECQAFHLTGNNRLLAAVIQKAGQTKVERGENAGLLLNHVQIVRKLQGVQLNASGIAIVELSLPKGFDNKNWEVLGLVQDQRNGEILAAAKANLNDDAK
jgi:hypothetical protein